MVKKSTPAEKAARMLDLVPFISSHQGISVKDLAVEFGILESELLSDLNALWFCGDNRFDLIELDFESGYVTIRNADTLNVVRSLSSQEIVSVLLGLDLIAAVIPDEHRGIRQTIFSLQAKLGNGLENFIEASPTRNSETISKIEHALSHRKKLEIEYLTSSEDRLTRRTITPLEIYRSDHRDFVVAYCELTDSQRTFRIDRIQSIEMLDDAAAHIPLEKVATATISAEISILRDARRASESLGLGGSEIGDEVTVTTFSPVWLARAVIAAGGAIVLRTPATLRNEILRRAKSALDLYL